MIPTESDTKTKKGKGGVGKRTLLGGWFTTSASLVCQRWCSSDPGPPPHVCGNLFAYRGNVGEAVCVRPNDETRSCNNKNNNKVNVIARSTLVNQGCSLVQSKCGPFATIHDAQVRLFATIHDAATATTVLAEAQFSEVSQAHSATLTTTSEASSTSMTASEAHSATSMSASEAQGF